MVLAEQQGLSTYAKSIGDHQGSATHIVGVLYKVTSLNI
jgi:hypothetical protein